MRTTRDRIRHSLLFELLAVLTITPIGGMIFNVPMGEFGILAVATTTIALFWNYCFNLAFDHAMLRRFKSVRKTLRIRVVHAFLFEAGLLGILVPFIAWYLDVTWWRALLIDLSLAGFYIVYAFAFNWLYDVVFPLETNGQTS